ncbi:MAG: hypothetical protein IKQ67_02855 [Candidatus Methanomethylophilaceae archaeon]|nr:hypothetical protein [Candidatus Methanomethylophilaceae archaeon]
MKTKMIMAAVAMAALIMASFGVMAVDDNDAAVTTTLAGYGEYTNTTTGATDVAKYYIQNNGVKDTYYLDLSFQSTSAEQIFIYVNYNTSTGGYDERQGLFSLTSSMTVILKHAISTGANTIDVYTKLGEKIVSIPLKVYADQLIDVSAENTEESVADDDKFAGGTVEVVTDLTEQANKIVVKESQVITISGNVITVAGQTITATAASATPKYTSVFDHWEIFGETPAPEETTVTVGEGEDPATIVAVFAVSYVFYGVEAETGPGINLTELDLSDLDAITAPTVDGDADEITYEATVAVSGEGNKVLTITNDDASNVVMTAAAGFTAASDKYTAVFEKWQINGADITASTKITADSTATALYTIDLKDMTITIAIDGTFETVKAYAKTIVSSGAVDPEIDWTSPDAWTDATFSVPWGSVVTVDDGVLTIKDLRSTGSLYIVTATPADPDANYYYTASWTGASAAIPEGTKITEDTTYKAVFEQEASAYISVNAAAYASEDPYAKISSIQVACNNQIKASNSVTVKITYTNAAAAAAETAGYAYSFYKNSEYSATVPDNAVFSEDRKITSVSQVGPGVFVISGISESTTILVKATPFANPEDNVGTFYIKNVDNSTPGSPVITTVIESKDSSLIGTNKIMYTVSYRYYSTDLGGNVYTSDTVDLSATQVIKDIDDNATTLVDGKSYHTVTSTMADASLPQSIIFAAQALYTDSTGEDILTETLWTTA